MTQRPNFLMFVTDQQRADHTGYSGNTAVRTPVLDRLAADGNWWSNFFTASPTCMSNRASLMTGRMPSAHGVRYNGVPLDLDSVTFVDLLRDAGYRTAMVGKSHLQGLSADASKVPRKEHGQQRLEPRPEHAEARRSRYSAADYRDETIADWKQRKANAESVRVPYYGFEQVEFCLGHGDAIAGHYADWVAAKGHQLKTGESNAASLGETNAPQVYKPHTPVELYPTTFVAERSCDILTELAGSGSPFFLKCSFPDPHHPFTPPGKYWDMFDPNDMVLPNSFADPGDTAIPPLKHLWQRFRNGDTPERFSYPFVTDACRVREILAKTFGQIAMIDDAMNTVMRKLDALGVADNTVIIFVSDHGEYLGDHGLLLKGPIHFRSVVSTPFVWRDPDPALNRGQRDTLGSTIDISSTILERAGLQPFNGVQGLDLFSSEALERKSVLIEQTTQYPYLGFDDIVAVHTYVDAQWRLSVWQGCDWGELYDLRQDPDELQNRWDDANFADKKAELLLALVHAVQDHADHSPYPASVS